MTKRQFLKLGQRFSDKNISKLDDWLGDLNPDKVVIQNAYVVASVRKVALRDIFQFERLGDSPLVELVARGLSSADYLSFVVCGLLHRSGIYPMRTPKDYRAAEKIKLLPMICLGS
ncbi:hypothetical protein RND71_014225 [Anisodus tanguticus]|uniref:tRNA synthetases class I (E and Q) anti-codon binding domain-containing protein n=1 Tax=Anisodus tanguticus TaxID=243964 RepID=A0AAE1SAB9_9SOLA|nr:hypothetical protein RND71_014225 [Anisodus tanguticus]